MKARLGLRKAKQQLDIAVNRLDEAVYLASFDIDYLGSEALPTDKDFLHKLKSAHTALKAVQEVSS